MPCATRAECHLFSSCLHIHSQIRGLSWAHCGCHKGYYISVFVVHRLLKLSACVFSELYMVSAGSKGRDAQAIGLKEEFRGPDHREAGIQNPRKGCATSAHRWASEPDHKCKWLLSTVDDCKPRAIWTKLCYTLEYPSVPLSCSLLFLWAGWWL